MAVAALKNELLDLFGTLCNGSITAEEEERLGSLLGRDCEAQKLYVRYLDLHLALTDLDLLAHVDSDDVLPGLLADLDSYDRDDSSSSNLLFHEQRQSPPTPVLGFLSTTLHSTIGYFSQEVPFACLIATVLCGFGILIGSLIYMPRPEQIEQIANNSSPIPTVAEPQVYIVGRITSMVDCKWADPTTMPFGDNIVLGRRYALASGLMEITYDTGAKVILQGPVTYEVESPSGGYLSLGKLTARLEKKADSPLSTLHSPLFSVRTPTATVTDLGTEFGVEVSNRGSAEVCVLVGAVRVENHKGGISQVAYAGEAFKIDAHAMHRVEASKMQKQFVRTISTPAIQDSAAGNFHDDFAGKPSRHWINPNAAIWRDNRVIFVDLAFLRTTGDFNYGNRDFVATVKMTNADKGAQGSAFFGLGDGTFGTFYKEPCADGIPSVYLMYTGPGFIHSIGAVHSTQTEAGNGVGRKGRNIPATEPQPAGTTITVELAWTVATDTAVFSIDTNNDGVYEHRFSATYPGLSSSEFVSRLFIGGANGVSFSDFNVTVGPHAQAPANTLWDDESAATKK